jgi:hypothetical protein
VEGLEAVKQLVGHIHPPYPAGFGGGGPTELVRPAHPDKLAVPIHITALQPQEFPQTHPGAEGRQEKRIMLRFLGPAGFEEEIHLLSG